MKYLFVLLVAATVFLLPFYSCKTVQGIKCLSIKQIPVTVIGLNGVPHTNYVPYCDTIKIIPKNQDTVLLP